MPASFRTYEAQNRLIAAVLAAHPDLKLNYKVISKAYGSSWTESGIEHYMRPIRKAAIGLRDLMEQDIAMYFGGSTEGGISWQFRSIKADAEKLKRAVANGDDPATALTAKDGDGSAPATPASAAGGVATPTTGTGRKRAAPRSAKAKSTKPTPGGRKPKKAKLEPVDSDGDQGQEDIDYEILDSPSRDRGRREWRVSPVGQPMSYNAPSTAANNRGYANAAVSTGAASSNGSATATATPAADPFNPAVPMHLPRSGNVLSSEPAFGGAAPISGAAAAPRGGHRGGFLENNTAPYSFQGAQSFQSPGDHQDFSYPANDPIFGNIDLTGDQDVDHNDGVDVDGAV